MEKAFGFIDAAIMNNADAIAVLTFGFFVGTHLYPGLADRGIKIPTTYKFALGSALGAAAIGWALFVEGMIHHSFETTGKKISVLWQTVSYCLIGEIFAVSAAYEVAFTASPPDKKVMASAVNLFCIGGLPNVICIGLYYVCRRWFTNKRGTASIYRLEDYATAHIARYFLVLFGISIAGVLLNLVPSVRAYVEGIEERAADMLKSPKTPSRPPQRGGPEDSPMVRARRHKEYLKYGSGPVLHKQGSMRAGPSMLSKKSQSARLIKKSVIKKLYRNDPVLPGVGTLISSQGGKLITAGQLYTAPPPRENEPLLLRANSG
jgi:POT family proton-dependent oligopeptide transporter